MCLKTPGCWNPGLSTLKRLINEGQILMTPRAELPVPPRLWSLLTQNSCSRRSRAGDKALVPAGNRGKQSPRAPTEPWPPSRPLGGKKISIETRQNLLSGIAKRGLKQCWFLRFNANFLFHSVICELNMLHFRGEGFGLQQTQNTSLKKSSLFQV